MNPRIRVSYECTPLPYRGLDWCAWDDVRGSDSSPYGRGETAEEAIADLEWRLAEEQEAAE